MKDKKSSLHNSEYARLKATFNSFIEDKQEILSEIRDKGLIVSGDIGVGKTVFAQVLTVMVKHEFTDKLHIGIFDKLGVWHGIFSAYYQFYGGTLKINHLTASSTRFRRTDKHTMLYLLAFKDAEMRREVIRQILEDVYERQALIFNSNRAEFLRSPKYLYVNEEAETSMSTYAIRKNFLHDYFSTCRNFNIANIAIVQRLSEISPKIREKIPNHAFGFTRGSNNLRHIRDITDKETREQVKNLGKYEFLLFINSKRYMVQAKGIEKLDSEMMRWRNVRIEDVIT